MKGCIPERMRTVKLERLTLVLIVYIGTALFFCCLAFLLCPVFDSAASYRMMLREGFFAYVSIYPLFAFFSGDGKAGFMGVLICLGVIIPLSINVKKRRITPIYAIACVSMLMYVFMGLIAFGIRKGEF